jgi:hypothetical protein
MPSDQEMTIHVLQLLRQRLRPLASMWGPLFAGPVRVGDVQGSLYLAKLQGWLWMTEGAALGVPGEPLLSDEQVAGGADLRDIIHHLLDSLQSCFHALIQHLSRIENRPTFPADLGAYLLAPETIVVDMIMGRVGAPTENTDSWPAFGT